MKDRVRKYLMGRKVFLIKNPKEINSYPAGIRFPEKGIIYTVRDVVIIEGKVGLHLKEIINEKEQLSSGFGEVAFSKNLFRIVTNKSLEAQPHLVQKLIEEMGFN